jgi:hypothetical protein
MAVKPSLFWSVLVILLALVVGFAAAATGKR